MITESLDNHPMTFFVLTDKYSHLAINPKVDSIILMLFGKFPNKSGLIPEVL